MNKRVNISPFSVLLATIAITITGLLCVRSLSLSYIPEEKRSTVGVSFSYGGATPLATEKNVTSVLESALSRIKGCEGTSSVSSSKGGRIYLTFGSKADMRAVRLEVATIVRSVYPRLPDGVSYPDISLGTRGVSSKESIVFVLKGDIPTSEIYNVSRDLLLSPLSSVKGVERVDISGYAPLQTVIEFDVNSARSFEITSEELFEALRRAGCSENIGLSKDASGNIISVWLKADKEALENIPVASRHGFVVHLSDLATIKTEEAESNSYYRINGLNTLSISVWTSPEANSLKTISNLKQKMEELSLNIPDSISYSIGYDSSEFISSELNKILARTLISIIALIAFVLISYRSLNYTFAVLLTITANISTALLVYYIAGLNLHLYSLAGITISMGMMIDSTIIMTDYYSRKGSRAVIWAIFGAVATTIAALFMTFTLPSELRANLSDFIYAITINLAVSLAVAYFFVPSLLYYIPLGGNGRTASFSFLKKLARFDEAYEKYISFFVGHKWILLILLTVGFAFALRLFYGSLSRVDFGRLPQKKSLLITTGLSQGHTVQQLDKIVRQMENYLAQYEQIELFTSRVQSYDRAVIEVFFKPEYENTFFPMELKQSVISAASDYGGANWTVSGIDDKYFSNYIGGLGRSNAIQITGYNFNSLFGYAQELSEFLQKYSRVRNIQIRSSIDQPPLSQIDLKYDFEKLAVAEISPNVYYRVLQEVLYKRSLEHSRPKVLRSSQLDVYDLWQASTSPLMVSGSSVTLSDVGVIEKTDSKINIVKENQSYRLLVCYDFLGGVKMNSLVENKAIDYLNTEVLPMGYKANSMTYRFDIKKQSLRYVYLVFLILLALFVFLSVLFESLRYPLAVIIMVPVSIIGLFLVFGFSSYIFDAGGFSAIILSAGITVNAGIYMLWTFKKNLSETEHKGLVIDKPRRIKIFMRSFHQEIRPIMLTIISTVIGLAPFLIEGPQEAFWFDFALGVISTQLFSLIAVVFYLPVFANSFYLYITE